MTATATSTWSARKGERRVGSTRSPARDIVPSWSADGRWIYFASDRAGKLDIWRIPPDGGEAERVTTGGGFETFPTPDGRYLYYSREDGSPLRRRDLASGEEAASPDLGSVGRGRSWSAVEEGYLFPRL